MKKLVYSVTALCLTSVPGWASEDDWSQLDKEVEALSSSLSAQGGGPMLSGFIQTLHATSDDIDGGGGNDLSGFDVPNARLRASGNTGDHSFYIDYNFAMSELLDAKISFPIGSVTGTVGQFKPPVLRSALIDRDQLVFLERTAMGALFAQREEGAMLSGAFDQLSWYLSGLNGDDDAGDEYLLVARVAFDFLGEGLGSAEGSYGGSDEVSAMGAVSYFNDGESEGEGIGGEVYLATNVYSFGGEVMDFGNDGAFVGSGVGGTTGFGLGTPVFEDSTPYSVSGTYMLTPDTWELGGRFQDADDDEDTTLIDVAVNYYMEGHDLKITAQFTTTDSDDNDLEADIFAIGMLLGF